MELAEMKKVKAPAAHRFETPSGDKMVILPAKDFDALLDAVRERLEDAADIASAKRVMARVASGAEGTFPLEILKRLRKENRIKVLREYREMTQKELAEKAGTDPVYISQLENNRSRGGLEVLRKIAAALRVDLDVLSPPEGSKVAKKSTALDPGERKLDI
jgi:DNA-binding XRE family transcriptional regulator